MLLEQLTGVGPKAAESPSSPLELDTFMLQQGEPSCRRLASSTPLLDLDELGFVKGIIGVVGIDTVGERAAEGTSDAAMKCDLVAQLKSGKSPCHVSEQSRHAPTSRHPDIPT
jgi:hypothetical protein